MTMNKKPAARKARRIPAGVFKAKCLRLLDEVDATGETLVITKRGRPVARIIPAHDEKPASLLGSVVREKDLVSPTGEAWEAET